jgi:hypothetical protein
MRDLPKVRSGTLTLAEFLEKVCVPDLKLRVRLANGWLFQLALTMDPRWRSVACKAHRELLEAYTARWVPVYEEGMRILGLSLRPNMNARELAIIVGAVVDGFAARIVGTGNEQSVNGEDNFALYATAVQCVILAVVDPGDGRAVSAVLSSLATKVAS